MHATSAKNQIRGSMGRRKQPARAAFTAVLAVAAAAVAGLAGKADGARFRAYDASTANAGWGAANSELFSYFPPGSTNARHKRELPSARYISNILCDQQKARPNAHGLSEFANLFGQFVDHDLVATLEDKSKLVMIPIPPNDPTFTTPHLPFHPSLRSNAGAGPPVNNATGVLDLSQVYGNGAERAQALRLHRDGLLRHSADGEDLLQLNTLALRNAPVPTADFFLSGDHRVNEHPVLTALHTVFSREHNRLADWLRTNFTSWQDEKLFQVARALNILQANHIIVGEFYPAFTGERAPRYDGFKRRVNPAVSVIFSTAAFRVGHSMVNERVPFWDATTNRRRSARLQTFFWSKHTTFRERGGVNAFLRPVFASRAQEVDEEMVSGLRNFLFKGVTGQTAVDLASHNIQRGRDHQLPTLNEVRARLRMPLYSSIRQLAASRRTRRKLEAVYGTVDRVELWTGLLAEKKRNGAPLGPTTVAIWRAEFKRLTSGDRFYAPFSRRACARIDKQLVDFPFCRQLPSMRDIILRSTSISPEHIPSNLWIVS